MPEKENPDSSKVSLSAVATYRRRHQQKRFPWIAYLLSGIGILLSMLLIFVLQYFFLR
ncbi:MAG: hypothetical protein LR015_12880 [Verrucomicrobia bacterium]|nr:hypothetical protein [Verrucomicrobiota bacterium]